MFIPRIVSGKPGQRPRYANYNVEVGAPFNLIEIPLRVQTGQSDLKVSDPGVGMFPQTLFRQTCTTRKLLRVILVKVYI